MSNYTYKCKICGQPIAFGRTLVNANLWLCDRCGSPYEIVNRKPRIKVNDCWIPILKKYWEETKRYVDLTPRGFIGRKDLNDWLIENPEMLPDKKGLKAIEIEP